MFYIIYDIHFKKNKDLKCYLQDQKEKPNALE